MGIIDLDRLHADQAWVDNLILTHIELQATRHVVFTTGQQVSVEVEGAHYEARAWRHAIEGRILPSHIDQHGVRRQLVIGAHCQVQIVEHPRARDAGGVNVGVAIIVGFAGLFLLAFTRGSRTPDGRWIALVAIVGAVVLVLTTGIVGYRRRERRDVERTADVVPRLKQDTSGDHIWDA